MSSVDPPSTSASNTNPADDDLDPAAFIRSVRELSEKREREDAERYRKLEEEVAQGRRERAARRAERARSISPEKLDIASTAPLESSPDVTRFEPINTPTAMDSSAPESPTKDIPEFKGFGSRTSSADTAAPARAESSASKPSQSASSLARSGTLSWQQRPSSRGGGSSSRPKSMVLPDTSRPTSSSSSAAATDAEPSRDQIAASLGSRDPSWFRQTADRGMGSAAYRRSKDETGSASPDTFSSGRRGLPGMSRELPLEPTEATSPAPSDSIASETASRGGSVRGSTVSSAGFSTVRTSTSSKPDLKSLIAADQEQEKAAPSSDYASSITDGEQAKTGRTLTMSSSQARLAEATERPSSPTKGQGGFVRSAMMRRGDSVSKRWSAQPGPSLSRENSIASARSGFGGLTGSYSVPKLEPTPSSRETSNEPSSQPTSSSTNVSNMTATQDDKDVFVKPSLPRAHSRSKSIASNYSTTAEEGHTSPSSSPSKRWSPQKSSWLESAITKPDSPKPAPAARNSQPSWMADIAKAKAQKASGGDTTPKPAEDAGSRPGSPTKAPFGQGMLKRSESRDRGTPRSSTPKPVEGPTSRPASPTKAYSDRKTLQRLDSRDLGAARSLTPKPLDVSTPRSGSPTKVGFGQSSSQRDSQSLSRSSMPLARPSIDQPAAKISDISAPSVKPGPVQTTDAVPEATLQKDDTKPMPPSESTQVSTEAPAPTAVKPARPIDLKPKPEAPPKPRTDFRSTLRARAPTESKTQETPEFLSKFGQLKKTDTQNYVAPDVLKDNILRGKSDLAKTGGPVKTQRRDELKESLLAKKEQWQKEKDEGVVHERKVSNPPQTPQKPEALAKREMMGRPEGVKMAASPEKPKTATPEALARHKSLKDKPKSEVAMPELEKQTSAPASSNVQPVQTKQASETSRMAARFNPGLAGILARGPPQASSGSNPSSRPESSAAAPRSSTPLPSPPSEPPAEGAQLQDMRKGRAKGPKRRKGGAPAVEPDTTASAIAEPSPPPMNTQATPDFEQRARVEAEPPLNEKTKPRALPGSAASLMVSSLQKRAPSPEKPQSTAAVPSPVAPSTPKVADDKPTLPAKSSLIGLTRRPENAQATPSQSPVVGSKPSTLQQRPAEVPKADVPEFKGFGPVKRATAGREDNKENADESSPSVKSAASMWGRPASASSQKVAMSSQIQLPSKRDEEAAMRSAGLLASSPSRPTSSNGPSGSPNRANDSMDMSPSVGAPPKPNKPSRVVSGQLLEASPSKGLATSPERPTHETKRKLEEAFGSVPRSSGPLTIDVNALITSSPHQDRIFRTVRKTVYLATEANDLKQLQPQEDYTFFDERVYACHHTYAIGDGPKKNEIFLWVGELASGDAVDQAQAAVKKLAKEAGNAFVHTVRQGTEIPGFLQALGGILVTRRGAGERSSRQYMLCGRKHLGQIVFDEVDFAVGSLCSGFVYLVSYPVTLQETRLYLWKGSACSAEEISAARLAAMDLSETRDVIEVDDKAEFASFLKIFGPDTTRDSVPKAEQIWQVKAQDSGRFSSRLFRIQAEETKQGFFGGMFTRRPSWNSQSPARNPAVNVKVSAQEISPFTQADLDVDGIYLLDAHSELWILLGPMFASQPEHVKNALFGQTLLLASEYALAATSLEDRPSVPKGMVLLSGTPAHFKMLFRHWDDTGLWGTGRLMAGSRGQDDVDVLELEEVMGVACDE
ncbi:uncharacterized protein LTR77_008238 [Saxophila tyrrhenica]|uniref:DUF4045 domain-containing protein n=1 Tax=Saxophila tyrrhenica TaxID=1690608 RepID=A0AAV9P687_9PEZI|nr:hypothetical protein LTR77_008238 [Saxophila tyrrhenica]